MSEEKITLYRPVGPKELELIQATGYRTFPPRLPDQPFFYPVIEEAYAHQIAKDWNVRSSGVGYVTRFHVTSAFLKKYEPKRVGGNQHHEYWIPAEDLETFNQNIVGRIEVIAEYKGGKA